MINIFMTKKITDLLDLPELTDENINEMVSSIQGTLGSDKDHEKSMDLIYSETLEHAYSVMQMAINADPRSRSSLIEKSNMLYNTALTAKNSKKDAQLKVLKYELDRRKIELEELKYQNEVGDGPKPDGDAIVIDRNELLRRFMEQEKNDSDDSDK